MVFTYILFGVGINTDVFILNFFISELISFTTAFLIDKGAFMSNYIMELLKGIKNKLGSRGFRGTCWWACGIQVKAYFYNPATWLGFLICCIITLWYIIIIYTGMRKGMVWLWIDINIFNSISVIHWVTLIEFIWIAIS